MMKLPKASMLNKLEEGPKEDAFKDKPHLKKAFKEFDRLLQPILDRYSKKFNFSISKVEAKLERCEKAMLKYCDMTCLLYTSPSPRDLSTSRMPSSA